MSCNSSSIGCNQPPTQGCPDEFGCTGACPDFIIRRHDTKPDFKVKIDDCDGPLDLTDLILEASMWAKGKLKTAIASDDTYFALADNIGFNQIMVGDIILMDRIRRPEKMLVIGFDEQNRLVEVQRAYHGTTAEYWKKGSSFKIVKFMGVTAQTEMLYQDIIEIDGTTTPNVLTDSFLVYEWGENDTCLPGCYFFEFKLLKMHAEMLSVDDDADDIAPSNISFTDPNFTPSDFGCGLGAGVDWVRRFPTSEGFLIQITNSHSAEF